MSEQLAHDADCWSAYRDVAHGLEAQLHDKWSRKSLVEALPGAKLARFEANVRAAVARLDADASCLE
ncbi:MAG: hypothetical protein HYV09_32285 [Deltaproteobacteria bacterium]|nr:hypothetical protein [Deltaproteobacteria bacterium]